MPLLIIVSLIWAFSPGLTKGLVTGLDGGFVAAVRLALAFFIFLPFLRLRGVSLRLAFTLIAIGAVQFGAMYLAYNESLRHLPAHEVALFTLTTPIFVTLLGDALEKTFRRRALLAAFVAVAGAAVVVMRSAGAPTSWLGIALVQLSNAAFAIGQIGYRRVRQRHGQLRDHHVFALVYLGAFALPLLTLLGRDVSVTLDGTRLLTLLYLGAIASGVAFFLWNKGATRVSAGMLAVMNNAKIPLMVICSLVFFGESANLVRLAIGGGLLGFAVWLAENK